MATSHHILLFVVIWLLSAGAALGQTCASRGPSELAGGMEICVSSVLPSQSQNTYGPDNLLDGDDNTAWCEGVEGHGTGQEITISVRDGIPYRRLIFQNGYAKSDRAFRNNSRARTLQIRTDNGITMYADVPDHPDPIFVSLPGLADYKTLVVRLIEVYPGAKYRDTCITYISPDLDHERELELLGQGLN